MTIEERAELAVETFAAGKGNCTQSVLCAWEPPCAGYGG